MTSPLRIGLIGDRKESVAAHRAVGPALALGAEGLKNGVRVEPIWLPTETLDLPEAELAAKLGAFPGLWCVPDCPYVSEAGALNGIRFARERGVPFLGTCGGFQHAILGYARDVLGLKEAEHAEVNPGAGFPMVARLSCSLAEAEGTIFLTPDSRIRGIYGRDEISERYNCNFGLNPAYEKLLDDGRLRLTGRDPGGEVRALELSDHPFYIATLFQFERSALVPDATPHPMVTAYLEAVVTQAGG